MRNKSLINVGIFLIIFSIILTIIIIAKSILVPLTVSMLFAYLFYPLVWKIERRGVNRAISIIIVLFIVILIAGSASIFASIKLSNTAIDFTEIKTQLDSKISVVQNFLEDKTGINGQTFDHYAKQASDNFVGSLQSQLGSAFTSTTKVIFQIAVQPVFIFFLLFYRTKMAFFIFRLVGRDKKPLTLHILREVSTVSAKYLGGLFIVVAILAVLNSLGLYIIGIKYALAFGVLAALLNLIPYLGTFLGGFIPFAYVFFTVQNPLEPMIKVALLFMIIQFTENYLLTPNIVGNSIKMNPLAIILSLLFANMVWGVAGMLIIVPVLAILKVIMRNVDQLKPYAYLISDMGMDKYKIKVGIFKKIRSKLFN